MMRTTRARRLLQIVAIFLSCLVFPRTGEAQEAKPGLAVLYFDYTGQDQQLQVLQKGLTQILISDLQSYTSDYEVVERHRLQDVLNEQDLSTDSRFDASTGANVGRLLGAKYIVLGSFFDLMGTLRIDARLIEVETGRILGSTGKSGPMTDFFAIEAPLAIALGEILTSAASGTESPSPAQERATPRKIMPKPKKAVSTSTIRTASAAMHARDTGDTATANRIEREVSAENSQEFNLMLGFTYQ